MLQEIDRYLLVHESFAFETTLSGLTYARRIPEWQKTGYRVKFARVAIRVSQGGHNIPETRYSSPVQSWLEQFPGDL